MNILLIGQGSIGKRHLKNLAELKHDIEIYSQHLKKTKPSLTHYDLILICSPTGEHLKHIKQFKSLSKNFFIEKPLAKNKKEAIKIKQILKGKKVMVGYNLIFHPLINKVKNIINKKQLGDIFLAQIHAGYYLPKWRSTDYKKSYSASKQRGGGVSLDLIHEINYSQYLFPDQIKKIASYRGHVSDLKISSDDLSIFIIKQPDKFINISINYLNKTPKRYIRLFGSKSELYCDLINNYITITNNNNCNKTNKINFNINKTYIDEIKLFINHINKNRSIPDILSLDQSIKDLNIVNYATS